MKKGRPGASTATSARFTSHSAHLLSSHPHTARVAHYLPHRDAFSPPLCAAPPLFLHYLSGNAAASNMAPAGAAAGIALALQLAAAAAVATVAIVGATAATTSDGGALSLPALTARTPRIQGGGVPFLDALAAAHRASVAAPPANPTVAATMTTSAARQEAAAAAADDLNSRIEEKLATPLAAVGGGVSYAVARGGTTLAAGSLGEASVELGVPMTTATRTDVASVSKQFTAFLLYWLEHRGLLSLEDDVRDHIPELPRFADDHTVTLRHMVHHVSGLLDCLYPIYLSRGSLFDSFPRAALLASIFRRSRLRFPPGTSWEYSNTNYVLAGLVAERVTHKPLARLLREVIFEPLGMKDSGLYDSSSRIYPLLADSYLQNVTEASVPGEALGTDMLRASHQLTAIGTSGIVTTPTDLLRWAENYRNNTLGGGHRLIEAMETPYVLHAANSSALPVDYAMSGGYGGGLFILDAPVNDTTTLRIIHHGGAFSGYRSMLLRVPAAEMVVVLQATSTGFADPLELAASIVALAAPDVFAGRGSGGEEPEPTGTEATPDATDGPMETPAPVKPISVPRKALTTAAGVWTMDSVEGAAATFEVQVICDAGATKGKEREDEDDDTRGKPAGDCRLFADLGLYSRSLLVPVSATRFVGNLAGIRNALALEISPPANHSAATTAVLSVTVSDASGAGTAATATATAIRHPSLQVGTRTLAEAAGIYRSDELGATYTFIPRGGGLGLMVNDVEGRLGSTFIPCCVNARGEWGGTYTSARPALISEAFLGDRGSWLTMAFQGDTATLEVEDGADGRGDITGARFRRVGKCHA